MSYNASFFAQILSFIPKNRFNQIVHTYNGNRYAMKQIFGFNKQYVIKGIWFLLEFSSGK